MMDFFTCLTGIAGLLFYGITGKGEEVIQLLNLISVIEDVIELCGASLSFCFKYSDERAALHVIFSNTLLFFSSVYLLIVVMESSIDDFDFLLAVAFCIVVAT